MREGERHEIDFVAPSEIKRKTEKLIDRTDGRIIAVQVWSPHLSSLACVFI